MLLLGQLTIAQEVFINEIHYDNAGSDIGEAIEIAGPASTDLTNWSVVAYNGNGGSQYNTEVLTGSIPDQDNGFGTLDFPISGLQNGSPDGIALFDNNGVLVQFLSYEGSFTATDGPANGVTSTDIGVSEASGAAEGSSMQLQGNGTQYSDFTWFSGDLPNSFGQVNADQSFGGEVEAIVLINEVDADQTGTDDAEFVELFDGGFGNSALDGLVLVFYNGSNDLVYDAIDLDGYSTDANGYFVVGSSNVPNVDLEIFTTNGIQNGADAVALYNGDADDFPNNSNVTLEGIIDALVYDTNDGDDAEILVLLNSGQEQINEDENNNKDTESMQRLPNGSGGLRNTVSYTTILPTPGEENAEPLPITFIHEVQGEGLFSPIDGQIVLIEGIVVGDFQDTADGFYVQEEDADADANELTSEGVFVYAPGEMDVAEGDLVRVEGEVDEFFDLTQVDNISSIEILENGQTLPSLSEVTLPLPNEDFLERYEGMRVDFTQTLFITNTFLLGRGGELGLSSGDRLYQPTHIFEPGAMADALAMTNELNQIIIDDASTEQNPDPTLFPTGGLSFDNSVRGGDEVSNIKGVLTYAWSGFNLGGNSTNAYRVYVTENPVFEATNPRLDSPEEVGGTFKIASFNVLNYFNGDGMGGGFPTPRGADTPEEFNRQRDKIINAIAIMDADVVGLIEIENDGYDENSAIADLVDGLNAQMGEGTYAYVNPGVAQIGTDEIAVGFIYKPTTAGLNGDAAILDSSVAPTFNDDKNRPALLQTFVELSSGNSVNIAVNHFKSKGSPCDDVGDPNAGDGQGNCNGVRTDAAIALANWMATDPTNSGSEFNLITGDLNAYAMEDPISALIDAGYTDLINEYIGQTGYTFQFDGRWGYLDYAMANSPLVEFVTGTTAWHINADEPAVMDYNVEFKSENQVESFYDPAAFRSSDHDPVIVGLSLPPVVEPVCYANSVLEFNQGNKRNGGNISAQRSNPDQALGEPQENNTYNFVSLGFGGSITFELEQDLYDEGSFAPDFIIVETTFGRADVMCFENGQQNYPEQAFVEVSADNTTWYSLPNSYCRTSFVDISPAVTEGMPYARYIRLTDGSSESQFGPNADGYDVDGLILCQEEVQLALDRLTNARLPENAGGLNWNFMNLAPNEEGEGENEMMIFPNPISGNDLNMNIQSGMEGNAIIRIFDVSGRLIRSFNTAVTKGLNNIELTDAVREAGTYLIKAEVDGVPMSTEILIKQ